MSPERFDQLFTFVATRSSRRIVLAGLTSGIFAALPLALTIEETEAKQKGQGRKHKKRSKHKGQKDSPPASPPASPPPSPAPSPPPGPVAVVDATCPGPGGVYLAINNGNYRFAQTFTALASGPLVEAQLRIGKQVGSAGDYILRLSPVDAFGVPTNDVLASASAANSAVPDGFATVSFTFSFPFQIVAGTQYALVLTRPGSTHLLWEGHSGNTCAGHVYDSPSQTAPFLANFADLDLVFTTFVSS
jgi:hypothetical protein